jgi:hypothetical protein
LLQPRLAARRGGGGWAEGDGCGVRSGVHFVGAARAREEQRAAQERRAVAAPRCRSRRVPRALLLLGDLAVLLAAAAAVVVGRAQVAPAGAER